MECRYAPLRIDSRALESGREAPALPGHTTSLGAKCVTLTPGVRWREPDRAVPFQEQILGYVLAVEGFTVEMDYDTEDHRLFLSFHYRDQTAAPFGASLVYCNLGAQRPYWRHPNPLAGDLAEAPMDVAGQHILLRRWAALPSARDRTRVQRFWLGHPIPALAALGMGTLGFSPQKLAGESDESDAAVPGSPGDREALAGSGTHSAPHEDPAHAPAGVLAPRPPAR
jgi:hypothetical protein